MKLSQIRKLEVEKERLERRLSTIRHMSWNVGREPKEGEVKTIKKRLKEIRKQLF